MKYSNHSNMTQYEEFLDHICVISPNEFYDVMESLPEVNIYDIEFDDYNDYDEDGIAHAVIDYILGDFNWACAESVDYRNKSFIITDVNNVSDLDKIHDIFSKWTITNYSDLREELLEEEKENQDMLEKKKKLSLLERLVDLPLDTIKEITDKYAKKD